MSVIFLPGAFKSNADRDEKIRYYNSLLKFRSRLNLSNEKYSQVIQEQMEDGVPPAPFPFLPLEAQYDNLNAQKQAAIQSLSVLTSQEQAIQFVNAYLTSLEELVLFNDNFQDLYRQKLQGVRNISPFWLNQQWENFKPSISRTYQEEEEETGSKKSKKPTEQDEVWEKYKEQILQAFMEASTYKEYTQNYKALKIRVTPILNAFNMLRRLYTEETKERAPKSSEVVFKELKEYMDDNEGFKSESGFTR